MKLTIKKEEILKGLQRIQGVVEKKNTMPILSNMLLTADDKGVEIVATDLEIGLRGRYAAEVEKPGAVTVSAKKMYEIVTNDQNTKECRIHPERLEVVTPDFDRRGNGDEIQWRLPVYVCLHPLHQ